MNPDVGAVLQRAGRDGLEVAAIRNGSVARGAREQHVERRRRAAEFRQRDDFAAPRPRRPWRRSSGRLSAVRVPGTAASTSRARGSATLRTCAARPEGCTTTASPALQRAAGQRAGDDRADPAQREHAVDGQARLADVARRGGVGEHAGEGGFQFVETLARDDGGRHDGRVLERRGSQRRAHGVHGLRRRGREVDLRQRDDGARTPR